MLGNIAHTWFDDMMAVSLRVSCLLWSCSRAEWSSLSNLVAPGGPSFSAEIPSWDFTGLILFGTIPCTPGEAAGDLRPFSSPMGLRSPWLYIGAAMERGTPGARDRFCGNAPEVGVLVELQAGLRITGPTDPPRCFGLCWVPLRFTVVKPAISWV